VKILLGTRRSSHLEILTVKNIEAVLLRAKQAQRGVRVQVYPNPTPVPEGGRVSNAISQPLYPWERHLCWAGFGPVWIVLENLAPLDFEPRTPQVLTVSPRIVSFSSCK
jgi:hypothetical protein